MYSFHRWTSRKYLHDVHFLVWKEECKGLYYLRTETSHRVENVSEKVKLNKLKDYSEVKDTEEDCEVLSRLGDSNGCTNIYKDRLTILCSSSKQWFKEFNIDIIEHNLDNEEERLSFFQRINHSQEQLGLKLPQINTVPQIFIDGNRIGGYD